jgi:hypothetical protein
MQFADFVTDGNQVKTSGGLIRSILARFGESRKYTSEGGRTTRGTRPAAERLVARLGASESFGALGDDERSQAVERMQAWLFEHGIRPYFIKQRLKIEVSLDRPGPRIVADVFEEAARRKIAGAVAQHLVGAKLAVRFPESEIANYSFTTAYQPSGRAGDFKVGDTVFHVTVAPAQAVVEKCLANLKDGYRPTMLVPDAKLQAARQLAELGGQAERIGALSLEQFVGQNIEELGGFGRTALATNLKALVERYNQRVEAVETDRSILIELPDNL